MKLIFNNIKIIRWFINHQKPRVLLKIYLRLQLLELVKNNKILINQISNRIEEIDNIIVGQEYYRNRFPTFIESWQHLIISYKDILVSQNINLSTKDKNEKNLTARTVALLLYEYLEDFQRLNNKKLRLELSTIPNPQPILKLFDDLKNWYKFISEQFWKELANIRHQTIAHKNKQDVKILFTSIKEIDSNVVRLASTFIFTLYGIDQEFRMYTLKHLNYHKNEIAKIPYPTK